MERSTYAPPKVMCWMKNEAKIVPMGCRPPRKAAASISDPTPPCYSLHRARAPEFPVPALHFPLFFCQEADRMGSHPLSTSSEAKPLLCGRFDIHLSQLHSHMSGQMIRHTTQIGS